MQLSPLPTDEDGKTTAAGPAWRSKLAAVGGRSRLAGSSYRGGFFGLPEGVGLVLIGAAWLLVGSFSQYRITMALVLAYAVVCAGLVLLFGVAGQLSLGQAIFMGVGTVVAGDISSKTGYGLEVELLVAACIGFALGLVVGLPALRVSGLYLAIATFALNFAGQQLMSQWSAVTGGSNGLSVGPLRAFGRVLTGQMDLVYAGLVVLGVSFFLVRNLMRGRTGRSLHALRTSESAARSMGIRVGWMKLLAFALSATLASMGGVLYMHTISFVEPSNFGVDLSIFLAVTVIIGGSRRLLGAILGSAFVLGLPELMHSVQAWQGAIYGIVLFLVVLVAPGGIASVAEPVRTLVARVRKGRARPAAPAVRPSAPEPAAPARGATAASGAHPVLRITDLHVDFGGLAAIDGVSFDVERGMVLGLIGPNGAGKTSVFNAVSGFVTSQGSIEFMGTPIGGQSVRRRSLHGIGRTFQNLNLHPDRSALDHLMLGMDRFLRYHFLSEAIRAPWVTRAERDLVAQAVALLERLGLGDVAQVPVADLPYGLQKRVDVARALATRPALLLLDEPAAGLPTDEAEEMVDRVLALAGEMDATVVIIEHNVELVARVSHQLVVMESGKVLSAGDPASTLRRPEVVAAYLGE